MSGVIRIARNRTSIGSFVGVSRHLKVYINGNLEGDVKWDSYEDFKVSLGEHVVYVKMDWCRSRDLAVKVTDSLPIVFECHSPSLNPLSPGSLLIRAFGYYNDFFELRRRY